MSIDPKVFFGKGKKTSPVKASSSASKPNTKSNDINNKVESAIKEIELAFASAASPEELSKAITGIDIRYGHGDIEKLRLKALPKHRNQRINQALKWIEDEDDMVAKLVELKQDFAFMGFRLTCSFDSTLKSGELEGESARLELQNRINQFAKTMEIKKVVKDLLKDWFATDNMILHWTVNTQFPVSASLNGRAKELLPDSNRINSFCTLNPGEIEWHDALNLDRMLVPVPDALRIEIEKLAGTTLDNQGKQALLEKLTRAGVTQKWIDAVLDFKSERHVELKNEDGEFWKVSTKARKYYGLKSPSMYTIFDALESRKMLNQGEMTAAFMIKHFIMHVTAGESITQGPLSGNRDNWLSDGDSARLLALITVVSKSLRLVTNHTVKFNFVYPPKEIFNVEKFANCERRILNWAGVVPSVYAGTGSKASEGYLGIRRMISDISSARDEVNDLIIYFFSQPEIAKKLNIPEGVIVTSNFDEQVLKEPRQLLEEVKTLIMNNMHDPDSALRELGRNPEIIKTGRQEARKENEETQLWEPIATPVDRFGNVIAINKGNGDNVNTDKGGRPTNDGTEVDEGTRLQRPVMRQTANTP